MRDLFFFGSPRLFLSPAAGPNPPSNTLPCFTFWTFFLLHSAILSLHEFSVFFWRGGTLPPTSLVIPLQPPASPYLLGRISRTLSLPVLHGWAFTNYSFFLFPLRLFSLDRVPPSFLNVLVLFSTMVFLRRPYRSSPFFFC